MATAKKVTSVKKTAAPAAAPAARQARPVVSALTPAQLQIHAFEKAVRYFSAQKFSEARAAFLDVPKGPAMDVSQRARSYIQVCDRRLSSQTLEFRTVDDHYNYAVECLNSRDTGNARRHLESALRLRPRSEHVLYTLGICCALAGDGAGAYENLKLAIEIEPRNRVHARQDSDFSLAAEHFPNLRDLLVA